MCTTAVCTRVYTCAHIHTRSTKDKRYSFLLLTCLNSVAYTFYFYMFFEENKILFTRCNCPPVYIVVLDARTHSHTRTHVSYQPTHYPHTLLRFLLDARRLWRKNLNIKRDCTKFLFRFIRVHFYTLGGRTTCCSWC